MARPLILSLDVKTKSAQQSLDSFRKKVRSSFTSNDTKALEQNIKNTTKEINKLEGQIEKTKQKLRDLGQSDVKPKSVIAMEKELATLEKQLQKADAEFKKLSEEIEDLAARQVPGLTLEQSLKPEQYARFQELDNLIIKNSEDTEQLTNRINDLKAKLAEVKGNPELTEEGKRYNQELDEATKELNNQRQKLQELQDEMSNTNNNTKELPQAFNALTKPLKRIQGLIKKVFFFSLITKALRGLRTALGNIISQNAALQSSLAQIKGNLLTAFAPIWTAVLPVIQTLFNWLVKVTSALAQFISLISGKSVKASTEAAKALYKQATATKNVGSAAKGASDEVEKSLLDFDELNTISTPKNDGGSSAGGGTSGTSAPDFSSMLDESQQLSDFWSSLALTIRDVFFEWGKDLTAENIAEKIITAAGLVTGAVIGWALGGPKGALIGATIGAGLSLLLCSVIFNHDGKLGSGEILKSIVSILGAIAGGIIGFNVGGPLGAAIGIVIGAGLAFSLVNVDLDANGNLTAESFTQIIRNLLLPIAGGMIGFAFGGIAGALVGITVGAALNFAIQQSDIDDTGGKLNVLYGVILTSGLIISKLVATGLRDLPKLGTSISTLTPTLIGVAAGIALIVGGVTDFIKNGPTLQNTIMIIGGAIAIAVALATGGLSLLTSLIIGAVAAVSAFVAAIILEEPAIKSVKEAQEALNEAKEKAAEAENSYIDAVDNAEAALKRLEEAEKAAGVTGDELYKKVQDGTLDYADMTDAQKELYKAYLDNEQKQKDLKTATEGLTQAKKDETLASFENELAVAKESGSYDKYKKSIIDAFEKGTLSAEESRDLLEKAMSEMSTDAQQAFMTDIPNAINDGMDPDKYETTWKKFKDGWSGMVKGVKKLLGIHSPSKVFAEIGENTLEGYKEGIDDTESDLLNSFSRIYDKIKNTFTDSPTWFSDKFKAAWKAIQDIFSGNGTDSWDGFWTGLWDSIKTKFSELGTNLSSAIGDSIRSGLNSVITWVESTINKAINLINGAIDLINLIPGVRVGHVNTLTLPRIPPLAQGAVLPPNQPFLAMVGDQKHGTNIEAPLSTIEEAVENVLNKRRYTDNQTININFTGNLSQLARVLNPVIEKEKNRGSTKLVKGGAY